LQLWDIAGHEKFGNMTRFYYKEALGALIVYDVTRSYTFEGVNKWKSDLDQKVSLPEAWGGGPIPVVLLANKSDLGYEGPNTKTDAEISQYCEEKDFAKWFKTSAVNNQNIEEAAQFLVSEILKIEKQNNNGNLSYINGRDDIIKVRSEKDPPMIVVKTFGTGWCVGWLIKPKYLITVALSAHTRIVFCVNSLQCIYSRCEKLMSALSSIGKIQIPQYYSFPEGIFKGCHWLVKEIDIIATSPSELKT
ncbi:10556_t:CDS:2, partial [Gigaspora rosea]